MERTAQAEADLIEIGEYIARHNIAAAEKLLNRIDKVTHMLAEHPRIGRRREKLARGLRSYPVGNYLIFYLTIKGGIEVVRVLSGYRDVDSLFSS